MDNETGKIKNFTDLDAWKESHKLVLMIYDITNLLNGFRVYHRTAEPVVYCYNS